MVKSKIAVVLSILYVSIIHMQIPSKFLCPAMSFKKAGLPEKLKSSSFFIHKTVGNVKLPDTGRIRKDSWVCIPACGRMEIVGGKLEDFRYGNKPR